MKCSSCKEDKHIDLFSWSNKSKLLKMSTCKNCHSIRNKEYSKRPDVKIRKKQLQKQYEKDSISLKILRSTPKYKEYRRKWELSEAGKLSRKIARHKRREKELYDNYLRVDLQYTFNLFNNKCFNCESVNKLELDHHNPLSKSNILSRTNAVILCKSCNSSKKDKLPKDFYNVEQLRILEEQYNIK